MSGLQMEVFPEVRAIIDLDNFKDKKNEALNIIRLGKALSKCQNGVNSYEVTDSFEKIDEIHAKLLKLKNRASGAEATRSSGAESARSSDARSSGTITCASLSSPKCDSSLSVNEKILNYVEVIYGSDLQRIEKDYNVQRLKCPAGKDTISVMFIQKKTKLPCPDAKEKFISLYQPIATNLMFISVPFTNIGRGTTKKDIETFVQNKLPKVLVTFNDTELALMGNPIDVKEVETALYFNTCLDYNFKSNQLDTCAVSDSTDSNRTPPLSPDYKPNSNSAAASSKLESKDEDTTCPICLDEIEDRDTLKKCKHSFCKECIKVAFKTKSACPICGEVYGEIRGNQPDGSRMTFRNLPMSLPGYEKSDIIEINYTVPDGIQGMEHPQPGQRYYGTTRTAYLPGSSEGRKVLKLLQRAFDQRLIFTVGTSSTTGRSNVVTWNDIHHKTSTMGGPSTFGYPDPTYLARVQDELKAKGIY
uniref:E3 ubiquitin-protein ligase DTX3L n=1 Tax=Pristiophorus japonicus TaxID=55135 RepID=UPI00398ECDCA